MADVRFEQATRIYPGTDVPAVDALDLHDRRRRVRRPGRSLRLRQDDRLAHARRPRGGRLRLRPDRGPRRHRPRAEEARRRDGLPELRALPVSDGGGEHGLPAQDRARQEVRARAARPRRRGAARADGVPGAQAGPALGRPAAASGDGPRDRARAERLPDGRAALEPRREAPRADARRHRRAAGAPWHDDGLRHARPVRGDDARASRRRPRWREAAAVRGAAGALRPAGRTPSSPASSARRR